MSLRGFIRDVVISFLDKVDWTELYELHLQDVESDRKDIGAGEGGC